MNSLEKRKWKRIPGSLFVEHSGGQSTKSQVLLHGFTQTSRSWDRYIDLSRPEQSIIRVDAPGHAHSTSVRADLPTTASMVVEQSGLADYIGYSMGARLALHIALLHPENVRRLILVSGSPGLRSPDDRSARVQSDEKLALEITEIGVDKFVEKWLSAPMFRGLISTPADIQDRLRNTSEGLASSLRLCGTGTQESLWDRLHELNMPVLLVVGSDDDKFRHINDEMKSTIGANAELTVINNASHSVHLEQTPSFQSVVSEFLN
ncbi:MAG: alpha/beta fold hydrolase [Actinomycetota bacterium]|nr:alpha/beta fold hydrolase [Actinomycetota bacterium]MDA3019974.1 alpha/beta fold hydrolase [Actinomycetota bacterium]